jgi:hypothetical protein
MAKVWKGPLLMPTKHKPITLERGYTMKESIRTTRFVPIKVKVLQADISDSRCRNANWCMIKVATERALRTLDTESTSNHHTRVDAGHVRAHIKGFHAKADLPKKGKANLILFDSEEKARRQAEKDGKLFLSKVKPFGLILNFALGRKVTKFTRERQTQINEARRRRTAAGKKERRYTLRQRIIGFA